MNPPTDAAPAGADPQPSRTEDLAHDMRNALAAITYSSMLLQRGSVKDADAEQLYATIRRQTEIMQKLVNAMVDASKDFIQRKSE